MSLEDSLFGIHGKALQLRSQRLELIASNIANASTPGYKARDIDFDAALAAGDQVAGHERHGRRRTQGVDGLSRPAPAFQRRQHGRDVDRADALCGERRQVSHDPLFP